MPDARAVAVDGKVHLPIGERVRAGQEKTVRGRETVIECRISLLQQPEHKMEINLRQHTSSICGKGGGFCTKRLPFR